MIFCNVSKNVVDCTVLLMRPSCNLLKNCTVPLINLDLDFMLFQAHKKWVNGKILFLLKGGLISYVRKFFRKTNISYSVIHRRTCVYQRGKNVNFVENFA